MTSVFILWCVQMISLTLFLPTTSTAIVSLPTVIVSRENHGECLSQFDREAVLQSINANISNILMDLTKDVSEMPECGEGMWHQVVNLNMTDLSQECPSTWRPLQNNGTRVCAAEETASSSTAVCKSVFYNISHPYYYTKVCGRAIGYQIGDAAAFGYTSDDDINSAYVYGLSITHGTPRNHIWTFAGGNTEQATRASRGWDCPCNNRGYVASSAPSFVGDNYFCEAGPPKSTSFYYWYTNDQLWDGQQCSGEGTCCSHQNSPPWFRVVLPAPTSDSIEARICKPRNTPGENVVVQKLEIYIQ